MKRAKIYKTTAPTGWDIITDVQEVGGQVIFDFDPSNYIDVSGNINVIIQTSTDGITWTDISSSTGTTLYETELTNAFVKIDQDGFIANDGTKNTVVIDKNGIVTIIGDITATSGKIANWVISGNNIKSADNSITLDSSTNTIKVGQTDSSNVTLSTANGVVATKGTIGGWTISQNSINAGTLTLTGGATPSIAVGSNVTLSPIGLTISNGALNINTGTSGVVIDNNGIKATKSVSEYAQLNSTGLTIMGGAINITTNDNGSGKKLVMNSTGIISYKDANNRVEFDSDGIRCIKNGTSLGSALTSDGIYGQLLTDQSIAGSKFDKTAPAIPSIVTGSSNTYAYVEQTATTEFVNIRVKFSAVTDTDREGYKIYLKEGTPADTSYLYYPAAVVSKSLESGGYVIYDIRGVKSNTTYSVKVTSYDVTGNESDIDASVAVQISGIKDTIAPKPPTTITVLPGFKMMSIRWTAVTQNTDNSTCVDLDYYSIERSTDGGTTYTAIAKVYTDFIIDKDVDYSISYKYRVKAVDLSGNSSTYVTSGLDSPSRVDKGDLVEKSITTELLNIGSIVKSINRENTTLFHFDGTLMSTQGLTPYVDSNKIIHQNGFFKKEAKFGASLSIEEDTTNLIAVATENNANFKSSSNGWTVPTGSVYATTGGVDGVDDGYFNVGYNVGSTLYVDVPVIAGKTYTISAYGRSIDVNSKLRVDISPQNGDLTKWASQGSMSWQSPYLKLVINSSTTFDWKRYSSTFTVPELSSTTIIRVYLLNGTSGSTVSVDSVQLEQRAYATSFVNGIKTEGYVDYYSQGLIKKENGVIAFWAKNIIGWHNVVDNDHPDDSPYVDNWFVWGKELSSNKILVKYNRQNSTLTTMYGDATINYIFPSSILNDDWIHFAYEWTNGLQTIYVNGEPVATSSGTTIGDPDDTLFRLGYFPRVDGSGNIIEEAVDNGQNKRARSSLMFDEFRIDKVVVDSDEIRSWYNQDAAFYDASAQIDADSQNISAANASVTINNEGITVKDGKIAVESNDGKILLRDGRLQVNGLDVGVPQSDNSIYNGNFTIIDTNESVGDAYVYDKGISRFGAKYWTVYRTSPPLYENSMLSVVWGKIDLSSYISYDQAYQLFKQEIDPSVKTIAKLPPHRTNLADGKLIATTNTRNGYNGWQITGVSNDNPIKTLLSTPINVTAGQYYTISMIYYSSTNTLDDVYLQFNGTGWPESTYYYQPFSSNVLPVTRSVYNLANNLKLYTATFQILSGTTQISQIRFDSDVASQVVFVGDVTVENSANSDYVKFAFDYGLTDYDSAAAAGISSAALDSLRTVFTNSESLKLRCVKSIYKIVDDAIKQTTYTSSAIQTAITTDLSTDGIVDSGIIGYTYVIADNIYNSIASFVEYQIYKNVKPLSPTFTDAVVADCQTASRNALNIYIDNYSTDVQPLIIAELTPKNTSVTGFSSVAIPATIQVVQNIEPFCKMSIEQQIDNQIKSQYSYLNSENYGLLSYNDIYGLRTDKVYNVSNIGEMKEVDIDLTKTPINITLDPSTGLPPMSDTPFAGGNTNYFVYPFSSLYGRLGYVELGVHGSSQELIQMSQPVSNLITYTDGVEGKNANYKQHTFSFNSMIKEDASHSKLLSSSGKLEFEVEELTPMRPLDRNPITGIVPVDPNDSTKPKRKSSYEFVNGTFKLSPSCEFTAFNADVITTDDNYILINTIAMSQGMTFGNADFDLETESYTVNTIKDALSINCWITYGASYPSGLAFSHPVWGDGYVKNNILYVGAQSSTEIDETKNPVWSVRKENGLSFIESAKTGDFFVTTFASNTMVDVDITIYQKPDNGLAATIVNGEFKAVDFSYIYAKPLTLTLKDFAAGKHDVVVLNMGTKGVSTVGEETKISFITALAYDWEKLTYTAASSDPNELALQYSINNNLDNRIILTKYIDGKYYYVSASTAPENITKEGILYEDGKWNTSYITPKYSNSVRTDGTPLFDANVPIKYRTNIKLYKDTSDSVSSYVNITGIQAELGTNPSYTRTAYGQDSIAGNMIQPYSKEMWANSGIQSRHFEEYIAAYPGETGIQSRHIADQQVISTKIANSGILSDHIAKGNVTFDKTRQKKIKLSSDMLTTDSYIPNGISQIESDAMRAEYLKYISMLPSSKTAEEFYVQYCIEYDSEFLFRNGQDLDIDDDYTVTKHVSFISAKDIYEAAVAYGVVADGGSERVLTDIEAAQLTSLVQSTNLYSNSILFNKLKALNILFYTKITSLKPIQTTNGYTDKFKIVFWEEL